MRGLIGAYRGMVFLVLWCPLFPVQAVSGRERMPVALELELVNGGPDGTPLRIDAAGDHVLEFSCREATGRIDRVVITNTSARP